MGRETRADRNKRSEISLPLKSVGIPDKIAITIKKDYIFFIVYATPSSKKSWKTISIDPMFRIF